MQRCAWVGESPEMIAYHDTEWGVPVVDDKILFEYLILDAFQAGLNWKTILLKRKNFSRAFDGFDPKRIARYSEVKKKNLLTDIGIIRNRQKIEAAVLNARCFLEVQKSEGSFHSFIWQFVGGRHKKNAFHRESDIPSKTQESEAMSKELMRRGFRFVGPTICYAFMQAAGMVNDHLVSCFRYTKCK